MAFFGKVMQFFGFTDSGKSSKDVTDVLPAQVVPAQVVTPLTLDKIAGNIKKNLNEAKKIKNNSDSKKPESIEDKITNTSKKQKEIRDKSAKCSSDISNIIDKVTSYSQRKLRGTKIAPSEPTPPPSSDQTNMNTILTTIPSDPVAKKIKKIISDTIAVDAQEEVVDTAKKIRIIMTKQTPAPVTPADASATPSTPATSSPIPPDQIGKLSEIAESSLIKSKIMYEQDNGELMSEFQDDLCKDYNEIGEELEDQLYQDFLESLIPQPGDNSDVIAEIVEENINKQVSEVIKGIVKDRISKEDVVVENISKRLTKFWLKKLKDNPVDSSIWKVIFKRTAVNIAALCAYDVFNSHCDTSEMQYYPYDLDNYDTAEMKTDRDSMNEEVKKPYTDLAILIQDKSDTTKYPLDNYKSVVIGDYEFTVGPIVDTAKFIGRTLVYIKCQLTPAKKEAVKKASEEKMADDSGKPLDHFYFWVYLSQCVGLFRVFFMLYAQASIEKGVDYTQGTLVHFKLQKILNKYYNDYYNKNNVTIIHSLGGVNHFILNMSYLQDDPFFVDLVKAQEYDNIFMKKPPGKYDSRNYYIVDSPSLLSKGMPIDAVNNPDDYSYDPNHQANYARVMGKDMEKYKGGVGNKGIKNNDVRTYSLVVCFTTVVLRSPPSSMNILLDPSCYNNTFWVQGARNYSSHCYLLSPVLYTVMGASLLYPDYELSKMRSDIMQTQGSKDRNFVSMTSMELLSEQQDYNVYLPEKTKRTSYSNARTAIFKQLSASMAKYENFDVDLTLEEDPDCVFTPFNLTEDSQQKYPDENDPSKTTAKRICNWLSAEDGEDKSKLLKNVDPEYAALLQKFETTHPDLFQNLQREVSSSYGRNTFETNLAIMGDFSNKRNFLYSMFDNAYNICNGLLNCDESELELYYLSESEDNIGWIKTDDLNVLDPFDPKLPNGESRQPYIFKSKFSEIKISQVKNSVPVTVHTLAHIYALKIPYTEVLETAVSLNPEVAHVTTKEYMYMVFQISSTIVYDNGGIILYGIDMQKTPIACLPDLDVKVDSPDSNKDILESIITSVGTFKRYSAWGAFFASKMMEYLGDYDQLPVLLKEFPEILQVCRTYTTTAPFFNYNNIKPYSFIKIPDSCSFSEIFRAEIPALQNIDYIKTHTESIKLFTEIFINPFVKQFDEYTEFDDDEGDTDDEDLVGGTIIVTTSNNENPESNISIDVIEIKKKNKTNNKNKSNKQLIKQRLFELYLKTGKIPKPKHKASLTHIYHKNVQNQSQSQSQSQSPKHRSKSVKIAKHINLRNTRRVRDGRK